MKAKQNIKDYGRMDIMAIAAFRYCLGRSTYIVGDCADWLIGQWHNICEGAQNVIRRDLDEAFKTDDDDRNDGSNYLTLGHDCDRKEWERVREFIKEKV